MLTDTDIHTIFNSVPNMLDCVKVKSIPNFIAKLNQHKESLFNDSMNEGVNVSIDMINEADYNMDTTETSDISSESAMLPVDNTTNLSTAKGKKKDL